MRTTKPTRVNKWTHCKYLIAGQELFQCIMRVIESHIFQNYALSVSSLKSVFECYKTYFSNKSMKSYASKGIALVRYCNQFLHAKRVSLLYISFDSSVLHCATCTQQNIMTAFLAGKLVREKNGRFGKAWFRKRDGNLRQRRKRQLSES